MSDEVEKTEQKDVAELIDMHMDAIENPVTVMSFSDLEKVDHSEDAIEELEILHGIAGTMIYNIKDFSPDKINAARKLIQEYTEMANAVLDGFEEGEESKEQKVGLIQKVKDAIASLREKAKPMKSVGGTKHPASDFLYVPDPNTPSTWKLPVFDEEHMSMAAQALSGSGLMGNKVGMPAGAKAAAKRKLRGMYKRMGKELPDSLKEGPLTVWKDDKGQWRWLANYSNNFRDNDHPAEIISKESHLNFERMVDNGEVDMPVLQHWHIPGSEWGKAEWVAFDEENGIAMAAGIILEGHEKEAEAIENTELEIGVSHGMPKQSLVYDPQDNSIIVRHITKEISDLPLWAAANKLTSFYVFKETDEMAIPDKKKAYLKGLGVSDEDIAELEAMNSQTKQVAEEMNIESKEASEPVAEQTETKPVEEATPVAEETPAKEQTEEKKESVEVKMVGVEEFVQVTKQITDALTALTARLESLETATKEMKDKETSVSMMNIPSASLAALIAQDRSVVGKDEARVTKKEKLSNAGPEETEAKKETRSFGNPVVDTIISNIIGSK